MEKRAKQMRDRHLELIQHLYMVRNGIPMPRNKHKSLIINNLIQYFIWIIGMFDFKFAAETQKQYKQHLFVLISVKKKTMKTQYIQHSQSESLRLSSFGFCPSEDDHRYKDRCLE